MAGEQSPTGVWTVEGFIDAGLRPDFFERNAVRPRPGFTPPPCNLFWFL